MKLTLPRINDIWSNAYNNSKFKVLTDYNFNRKYSCGTLNDLLNEFFQCAKVNSYKLIERNK